MLCDMAGQIGRNIALDLLTENFTAAQLRWYLETTQN